MRKNENNEMVFTEKEVTRILLSLRHSERLLKNEHCETLATLMADFRKEIEKEKER